MNIDPHELSKFDAVSDRWWDKDHGPFKALHDINPLRLRYIQDRVQLQDRHVLDVACGGGILAESMAGQGAKVTGIDLAPRPLEAAQKHLQTSGLNIRYRRVSVETMAAEQAGAFDLVTCMELLEHVPDPPAIIAACAKLVKPGGDIVLATLNRNPKSYLFAIIGAEYLLRLLPVGTHRWSRFVKPSELQQWLMATNLIFKNVTGLHYNPILRRYSLGGNLHVNYLMHAIRPQA